MSTNLPSDPDKRPSSVDRRWALIAVAVGLVLVVVVLGAYVFLPKSNAPAGSTSDLSPYAQLFAQVGPNGEVTKEMALEAFSLAIAPLPGVTVPTGAPPTLAEQSDSTFAVLWIMRFLDQLTPDQRAIVDAAFNPSPNAPRVTPQPNAVRQPDIVLAADTTASDYLDLADKYAKEIAAELGRPLLIPYSMSVDSSQLIQHPEWLAYSAPVNNLTECAIHVEPKLQSEGDSAMKNATIAHEMFHCFQFDWARQRSYPIETMPHWITEGSAEWAGEDLGGPSSTGAYWWTQYLKSPPESLFGREYDAVGFYQHMAEEGINPWTHFDHMLDGYAQGASNGGAYLAASGDDTNFLDTWASGIFRSVTLGQAWDATGPWQVSVQPPENKPTIDNDGEPYYTDVDQVQNGLVAANVNADILDVQPTGHVRLNAAPIDEALSGERWLCFDPDSCKCPPGQQYEGPNLDSANANVEGAVADFGLTGGLEGASLSITGYDKSKFCKSNPSLKPQPSGLCKTDCGNSNGDPHLRTVNRYKYDFQGAGEFVLLRSPDSNTEIQARQEPYHALFPSPFSSVSINTAVAALNNGHKVSVYATGAGLTLHVDGQQVDPASGPDLGSGAAVRPVSGGIEIDFPDGTILWTLSVGSWGINAIVQPSDALRSSGTGLLGPITPGGMGVPALPDGSQLPVAPDFETRHSVLYGQFADAWRVTDSSSLFDYDPGKSTATYTDKNFPSDVDDAALYSALASPDPQQQAAAQSACSSVTDTDLVSDCEFDVYATGDTGFAQQYAATQDLYDSGIKPPTPGPPGSPVAQPTSGPVVGAQQVVELQDLDGSAIGPDNTLYVSITDASGAAQLLAIDPTTAAIRNQVDMRVATQIYFAAGSVWAYGQTADANGQFCTVTRYDPQTLAKQGDYPIPCTGSLTSMGDAVWFVDMSKSDPNTGLGSVLTRIDPTTNAPGASVPLPLADGCCEASQGAIFCYCGNSDEWRLIANDSAFVDLGNYGSIYPAGTGFWVEQNQSAVFVDSPAGPSVTIPMSGDPLIDDIVGGDPTGVYFEGEPPDGSLSRQATDGSPLLTLAKAPTSGSDIGLTTYDYSLGGAPWFATPDGYLHLWLFKATADSPQALWLQWAPLP